MPPTPRDTIFARSSGAGVAGVAVFRVSGPRAGDVLDAFCGGRGEPRRARLARVTLPDGSLLDEGLTLWFPSPASFTGEDVAELHLHGSPAVERAFADAMLGFGLAPATAGAFTLRAFEAGKLDLAQAEGLGDLLSAETEAQRRQALGQLGGRLSHLAEDWRRSLLAALASLEAVVDFPDEEDVPGGVADGARATLGALAADMRAALSEAAAARRVREGITVVITGPPNAGKSSLLNALAGSERAIVSPEAGTTRDLVEARLSLSGQLVTLVDTAGLREGGGMVEALGMARAREVAATADLRIELRDARTVGEVAARERTLHVANKADLLPDGEALPEGWARLSVATGEGLPRIVEAITEHVRAGGEGALTRERHADLVRRAVNAIEAASERELPPEVLSEEVRLAVRSMEELTGRIAPDEVLGEVFSAFCIGK